MGCAREQLVVNIESQRRSMTIGNGREDVICAAGWVERPEKPPTSHKDSLGAVMAGVVDGLKRRTS